jgi:hypothetical protein
LTRFDVDFDLPELAAFPPEMYLTSRPDLGDVSQGKLVTLTNFFELFNGIISPRERSCALPATSTRRWRWP